jgi:hypothetical protein
MTAIATNGCGVAEFRLRIVGKENAMKRIYLVVLVMLFLGRCAWAESCADHLKEIEVIGSMKQLDQAAMKLVEESRAKAIELQKAGKDEACIEALNGARTVYGSKSVLDDTRPKND